MRKANYTILIIGAVGAALLSIMAWNLAEKSPGIADRMKTAQLVRIMYLFRSAVITEIGEPHARSLRVTCIFGSDTLPSAWDQEALRDVAKFVDQNFLGDRQDLRDIRVLAVRETGSGCSKIRQEMELEKPVPLTPPKAAPKEWK